MRRLDYASDNRHESSVVEFKKKPGRRGLRPGAPGNHVPPTSSPIVRELEAGSWKLEAF
jgi:hypothetical protein